MRSKIMISVDIRDKNLLVTLSSPAKVPIRARSGSAYFYNSMELLCVALGACFGGELVRYCSQNDINASVFESLNITMENFVPRLTIQHPKDMNKEHLDEIRKLATTCPIAKMLITVPEVVFVENTLPIEILTDQTQRSRCCGN